MILITIVVGKNINNNNYVLHLLITIATEDRWVILIQLYRNIQIVFNSHSEIEAPMFDQLLDYFELHYLFVPAQFNFRRGKSSVNCLEVNPLLQHILALYPNK